MLCLGLRLCLEVLLDDFTDCKIGNSSIKSLYPYRANRVVLDLPLDAVDQLWCLDQTFLPFSWLSEELTLFHVLFNLTHSGQMTYNFFSNLRRSLLGVEKAHNLFKVGQFAELLFVDE